MCYQWPRRVLLFESLATWIYLLQLSLLVVESIAVVLLWPSGWSKINYSPETLVFYWANLTSFSLSIFVVHWFSCPTDLLIVCEVWSIVLVILSDLLISCEALSIMVVMLVLVLALLKSLQLWGVFSVFENTLKALW